MSIHLKTRITAIGPEVAYLAEGGVLILFADGSPPELAEVSVLHVVEEGPEASAPAIGAKHHHWFSQSRDYCRWRKRLAEGARNRARRYFIHRRTIQLIAPVKSVR